MSVARSRRLSAAAVTVLAGIAMVALAAPRPVVAGPEAVVGIISSGVHIVNLSDSQPLTFQATVQNQSGGPLVTIAHGPVEPGRNLTLYSPNEPDLPNGVFSALLAADQPLGYMIVNQGMTGTFVAGSERPRTGTALTLPWAAYNHVGQTSYVTVQNTDPDHVATVQLIARRLDGTTAASGTLSLAAGAATTFRLGSGEPLIGLPSGFLGSLSLWADAAIVAHALVDPDPSPSGAFDFNALPDADAATTVYFVNARSAEVTAEMPNGHWDSLYAVVNPGQAAAEVTLTYTGTRGTCAGQTLVHGGGAYSLPPGAMAVFDQSQVVAPMPTGANGLPPGCGGYARLTSTGPVTAVGLEWFTRGSEVTQLMAYNALSAGDAANRLVLPVVRRAFVSLSTELHIANPGPADAHVTLRAKKWDGLGPMPPEELDLTDLDVPAGTVRRIVPEQVADWPDKWVGDAVVSSDVPVAVVVADVHRGERDGYMAQALAVHPGQDPQHGPVPLVLKYSLLPGQGPPPSPTRIVSPTPGGPTATVLPPPSPTPALVGAPKSFGNSGLYLVPLADAAGTGRIGLRSWSGGPEMAHPLAFSGRSPLTVYGPMEPVANGGYSAVVDAGVAMAGLSTVAFTDAYDRPTGRVIIEPAQPAADLVVPFAAKGVGGQNTIVTVQNADEAAEAEVAVDAIPADGGASLATALFRLAPGAGRALDIGRDPAFAGVGLGFVGTLRLRANTRLAAEGVVDVESSVRAAFGFRAEPAILASATQFLPRVGRQVARPGLPTSEGTHSTRIAVANPGMESVLVAVNYHGRGGSCAGQVSQHPGGPFSIPGGGMVLFDQGPLGADLPTGDSGLAAACDAAAVVSATGGKVLALAMDIRSGGGKVLGASAYNGFRAEAASRDLIVAMAASEFAKASTSITVLNPGPDAAQVSLSVSAPNAPCGAACTVDLAPAASFTWALDTLGVWSAGSHGQAWIKADAAVVAVADYNPLGGDDSLFAAQPVDQVVAGPSRQLWPVFLRTALLRHPGPALGDAGWQRSADLPAVLYLPFLGRR